VGRGSTGGDLAQHVLADTPAWRVGTDGVDGSRHLDAGAGRLAQGLAVGEQSTAALPVDGVDASGPHPDPHLPRPRRGDGDDVDGEHLGAP
jgi:hypothetical protein